MGFESEQEFVMMIGMEERFVAKCGPAIEECHRNQIYTQKEALEFIGNKIKAPTRFGGG